MTVAIQLQDQAIEINHSLLKEWPSNSTWKWQVQMVLAPPLVCDTLRKSVGPIILIDAHNNLQDLQL